MRKYRLVAKKGEGTFSEVLKAQNIKDGKYHAIKCMKNRFDSIDQVNNLREIQALRRLSPHEHIITLQEVLYDQPTGRLALVFELMDANLYELIRGRRHYLNATLIKSYMYQLLKSLDHMHRKGIFHRDIKPENILIESTNELGKGLKLADFGSCRGIYSKQPYTEYISTRWYRAPECLLTDGYYGPEMDMWGAGCVYFEITSLYPLFPGTNEIDQIARIHKVLGTPEADMMAKFKAHGAAHVNWDFPYQKGIGVAQLIPHASPDCIDLMTKLLKYDASERITAREALRHVYFKEMRELDLRRQAAQKAVSSIPAAAAAGTTVQDAPPSLKADPSLARVAAPAPAGPSTLVQPAPAPLQPTQPPPQQQPAQPSHAHVVPQAGHAHVHGHGGGGNKGLPNIGAGPRKDGRQRQGSFGNKHAGIQHQVGPSKGLSSSISGEAKSGLPPIIGAVGAVLNTNCSSKLLQHQGSGGSGAGNNQHGVSSRLHDNGSGRNRAKRRGSKPRVLENTGYRHVAHHQGAEKQTYGLGPGSGRQGSFSSFLQSKALGQNGHRA